MRTLCRAILHSKDLLNILQRNNYAEWVLKREGMKAYHDKVEPYIERDLSKIDLCLLLQNFNLHHHIKFHFVEYSRFSEHLSNLY